MNKIHTSLNKIAAYEMRKSHAVITGRCLLILSTACAILTLIPGFRLPASLALRSLAIISAALDSKHPQLLRDKSSQRCRALKVGITALAIIGIATATPLCVAVSLVAEGALHLVECGRALHQQQYHKAVLHLECLVVSGLIAASLFTGLGLPFLIPAGVVSIISFLHFGGYRFYLVAPNSGNEEGMWLDLMLGYAATTTVVAFDVITVSRLPPNESHLFLPANITPDPEKFRKCDYDASQRKEALSSILNEVFPGNLPENIGNIIISYLPEREQAVVKA